MSQRSGRVFACLCALAGFAVAAPAAHAQGGVWDPIANLPSRSASGARAEVQPAAYKAFRLDSPGLKADLRSAPKLSLRASGAKAATSKTIISLPKPDGTFERFAVDNSPIMEPGLAAAHPEIQTYAGVGLDDPSATLRADSTPLGFHASVRSPGGDWYIDPYYHGDTSAYVSYYGHDLEDVHGSFIEPSDQEESADPFGIGVKSAAPAGADVQLRTYRLALVTDPSYATYFGAANVTAAKVTLMNRVDQFYEDETAIRMVLINDTDKLNLNTDALATGANGPCGAAACYTAQQLSTCGSGTLSRNRIVIGQIVGASNYDIGHIGLGKSGGGVASLGVVGGNVKAQGCTGVPTPVGDYYAIDYVAHEMGHEFGGNHTFNGTQSNCSGGNRNALTSVEPGSGTSVMAYAGICQQDNLQPHSDPYWSQRSFDEITTYTSASRLPINEVQNVSLRDFDDTDSLVLRYGASATNPIVRGANYTLAGIAKELQGTSEVQTVALTGYDADGDSYALDYKGAGTVPIVRGQNNTAAGISNALAGGNEQQQVTLASFSGTTQSFQVQIGGNASVVMGAGGTPISNGNLTTAINTIAGFAGTVSVSGAGNTGFTVTFAGASANTDVPAISIVNCSGGCTAAVRETAKGGTGVAGWPAGATVSVGGLSDAGYTLTFSGTLQGIDVSPVSVTNGTGGTAGAVAETTRGSRGTLPPGTTAAVAGFGGAGTFDDTGFQVSFGGLLAGTDLENLGLTVTGGSGFVGETAKGGPIQNQGYFITPTGNHAPEVSVPAGSTIPTRTPFSLTGSATDSDGDPLTYMWEQNDRGGATGTALVNNTKANGPLFRQFGTYASVSPTDTLITPSPGENHVDTNPTRVFPDMSQILIDNTNAATGRCPAAPAAPTAVPIPTIECYSEFLPTSDWTGFLGDRTMTFRLTARDGRLGGGGVAHAETHVTIAPLAGPFRVTSQSIPQSIYGTSPQTITWSVNGTDQPPVNAGNVKISLSTDGGQSFPYVLADSTPNDGSQVVIMPNVTAAKARLKVEAVGNVFFDVNHADFAIVAPPTSTIGGSVPPTLTLSLGAAPAFGAFTPGLTKDYDATTTATVTSTAGDAALSVADATGNHPGHLVNDTFFLPSALLAKANAGAFSTVGAAPVTLLTYGGPVTNDAVTLGLRQHIDSTDALRTGGYTKTLTYTLSTTTP